MRKFTLFFLFLAIVACGRAQDLLVPSCGVPGELRYKELLYNTLLYDNPKQQYSGAGLWKPFYLVTPMYNSFPELPEYAFVVKDSTLILKRAPVNISSALFAEDRIKKHLIKNYDSHQQKVMRKEAAALKSLRADKWEMPITADFSMRLADLFECVNLTATHFQCSNDTTGHDNSSVYNTPIGTRYFNHWYYLAESGTCSTETREGQLNQMADSICYAIEYQDIAVLNRQYFVCKTLAAKFKTAIPVCYFTPWCNKSPGLRQPYQVRLSDRGRGNFELDINLDKPADETTVKKYRLLYADSVAEWTREAYIIHPFRKPQITLEETDSIECHIYIEQDSRVYREICEIRLPAELCRRDVILSTLLLPLGHYRLDSNHRWQKANND
ncbi:MAG: hypothetical protein II856_03125 [Bacteroidales bacterium]|nr:hypothetical protein [Bacteroidales bacterium]